jgi:archaeal flagellar protein FlaJ
LRVTKKDKRIVWIVSAGIGAALLATAVARQFFLTVPLVIEADQLFFISIIVAIFPAAMLDYVGARWKMSADKNIPEFLRELAEAGRTGVTLTRAIDLASKRKYGPLSAELERVTVKLSWGGNLDEALNSFAERVDTRLARRTAVLITEINRSGGEIKDVLEIVSKHAGELETIEEERRSQLRMYVVVIYVAFFVFLFIDFLLLKTFFAKMASLKEITGAAGGLFGIGDIEGIQRMMFHMCIIEGLFGGLVAGKMGEDALGAGLKHSVIMMVAGFVTFIFFI